MDQPLWQIVYKFNRLSALHRLNMHAIMRAHHLHFGQLPMLEFVMRKPGCSQKEVAEFLQVSPPSIATSVKRMQRAGLLEKQGDPQDLRLTRLYVTPAGRDAAQGCRKDADALDARIFAGTSAAQRAQFAQFLQCMIDNLATEEQRRMPFFSLMRQMHTLEREEKNEGKG
nr:MarR family winged helix-turn-helix transcriptional regulator [Maliibacterium massiliense]